MSDLVPEPISTLQEADLSQDCFQSARVVASDKPGHICVEVTSRVTAKVAYVNEDENPFTSNDDEPVTTYTETVSQRQTYTKKFYFAVDVGQASVTVGGLPPAPARGRSLDDAVVALIASSMRGAMRIPKVSDNYLYGGPIHNG